MASTRAIEQTSSANNILPNTSEINRKLLIRYPRRNEGDTRTTTELTTLFSKSNTACNKKEFNHEERIKQVHYGPMLNFPPGTCWGLRMECSRDCVHRPLNESVDDGIYGAASICTPHLNIYNDVDLGDILTFTVGKQASEQKNISLLANYKNKLPVRLVRSYCLSNEYAPKTGYRYDGLYSVVYHWLGVSVDNSRYNKFILVRLINQEPSVWEKQKVNPKQTYCLRQTRSQNVQVSKSPPLAYNELPIEPSLIYPSAIVSRQSFQKLVNDSPDSSLNSSPKSCNTNLSMRTNLYDSSHNTKRIIQPSCYKLFKINQQQAKLKQKENVIEHNLEESQSAIEKTISCPDPCDSTSNGVDSTMAIYNAGSQLKKSELTDNLIQISSKDSAVHINFIPNPITADSTTICEKERSLESLAPDKLVNAIVRKKYHPMAKLLIGNIIGLENHESTILSAYNTLTSKVSQDDFKENGIKKYYLKSKQRKNNILKKHGREIANLAIDAKFETVTRATRRNGRLRSPKKLSKSEVPKRKLINVKRLQIHKVEKRKIDQKRKLSRRNIAVQCSTLMVDQSIQTSHDDLDEIMSVVDVKDEVFEVEEIKSEPIEMESDNESSISEKSTRTQFQHPGQSAFAAVSSIDFGDRIALLRSINFRPIENCSPVEHTNSDRPDPEEAFYKYNSEETSAVGYMDEQLNFEDIEEEDVSNEKPSPIERLTNADFDKPWHGWKKIINNGSECWVGY